MSEAQLPPLPRPVAKSAHGLNLYDTLQLTQYAVRYADAMKAEAGELRAALNRIAGRCDAEAAYKIARTALEWERP